MSRSSYLTVTQNYALEVACRSVQEAFLPLGYGVYLVGSAIERRDWRDVDVRALMYDQVYDEMFAGNPAALHLLNVAVSEWLAARTGLPVDFQMQRTTDANREFEGRPRSAIGMWIGTLAKEPV